MRLVAWFGMALLFVPSLAHGQGAGGLGGADDGEGIAGSGVGGVEVVWLPPGGAPSERITAASCEGVEDATCHAAPLEFDGTASIPALWEYDTGWIPDGSIQLRFGLTMPGSSHVALSGDLVTSWPEAMTVSVVPAYEPGQFDFDWGVDVVALVRFDVSLFGEHLTWEGDIPFIPEFNFALRKGTALPNWAFPPDDPTIATGMTNKLRLFDVDLTDAIGLPDWIGELGVGLDTRGGLTGAYSTVHLVVWPVGAEAPVELEELTGTHEFPGGGFVEYDVWLEGEVDYEGELHLYPTALASVLNVVDLEIPIADYPIPVEVQGSPIRFEPVRVHVPLPDIEPPDETYDFGEVVVGSAASEDLMVSNLGEAPLGVVGFTEGGDDPVFRVRTPLLVVDPEREGAVGLRFAPTEVGDFTADLVLQTNDPDAPEWVVTLTGTAVEPPERERREREDMGGAPNGGGAGTVSDRGSVSADSGCGCRTNRQRSPWGIGVLLLVPLAASRRRKRHASRNCRS